jgi:multidrug resistance efflux pump
MKWLWPLFVVVTTLAGVAVNVALRGETGQAAAGRDPAAPYRPDRITADGLVEGAHPEVALRPEITGTIAALPFRENQEVSQGMLLVELSNETQKQQLALAEADVETAEAQLERLRNGERPERRRAAVATASARQAIYEQAKADWERSQQLAGNHAASREQWDRDYFRMLRARAEAEEAEAERVLAEAPARAEDVRILEARLAAAEARRRLAAAELARTRLTAPSDGRILRVYAEPGELAGPATAQPILVLADLSRRRVRAFVEELDAVRVAPGQRAVVTVDGLPGKEFAGTVVVVMPRMGKRTVPSDAPEEYKDLYFREVLLDLAGGEELVPNLRVKTRITVGETESP